MKKLVLFLLAAIAWQASFANGTTTHPEPEFIGEVYVINNDDVLLLEKNRTTIRTQANASMYIFGIGDIKSRIKIPNACSSTRVDANKKLQLIVRANNNNSDPLTIINFFEFDQERSERSAILSKAGTFSGVSEGTLRHVKYNAKKYGESSYLVTIENLDNGEYGITVTDANATEGSLFISCLGVGECTSYEAIQAAKKAEQERIKAEKKAEKERIKAEKKNKKK